MTDDTNGETTDEPTDDQPDDEWPKTWKEITRFDHIDETSGGKGADMSAIDPGLPMVEFGHGMRAYDGDVYMLAGKDDLGLRVWEPLRVHVDRMVEEALEEHTVEPSALVERAIAREARGQDARFGGDEK